MTKDELTSEVMDRLARLDLSPDASASVYLSANRYEARGSRKGTDAPVLEYARRQRWWRSVEWGRIAINTALTAVLYLAVLTLLRWAA